MASLLLRTGSGSITSSPRFSGVVLRSVSGCDKVEFTPLEVNNRRRISRAISEPTTISRLVSINARSQTFPDMLPVEEELSPEEDFSGFGCIGSLKFVDACFERVRAISGGGIGFEEGQVAGIGSGSGRDRGGFGSGRSSSGGSNDDNERNKIGARYRKLLELNPNDPLLLRNYGKFLHEVEGDTVKAEEYYGRAILASPGDGELLSLYGKLIWDVQRDEERAQYYFDQAISVSPDDCMVMGSYAQFMWEAEEDEDSGEESGFKVSIPAAQAI